MPDSDRLKWDAKYARGEYPADEPSRVLMALADWLPTRGRALDVAGGAGRNALWLARRGLHVTVADISAVALGIAERRAAEAGAALDILAIDLEVEPFPSGPWDLILSHHFLYRPLFARYPDVLAPDGRLVVVQPTVRNLERHPKPPAPFLLDESELPRLVAPLKILHFREGWLEEGRHEAVVVAAHQTSNPPQ